MTRVAAVDGYRIWAESYDRELNPLISLESRILALRLGDMTGCRMIDAATGTGRWMRYAQSHGGIAAGVDICAEMLAKAAEKPECAGRLIRADIRNLPLKTSCADLALCSFALGYLRSVASLFREMARIAPRVIVSDLHPDAVRSGWVRAFRSEGRRYELRQFNHSLAEIGTCARRAGLISEWETEAQFGEPEREIFRAAGKSAAFEAAQRVSAIFIASWIRA